MKFQEEFQIWIIEVTRVSGSDREFVWNSLMSLLDTEWAMGKEDERGQFAETQES